MIQLYFNLVIAKKRTCDKKNKDVKIVPDVYIDDVILLLNEKGYDINGNKK